MKGRDLAAGNTKVERGKPPSRASGASRMVAPVLIVTFCILAACVVLVGWLGQTSKDRDAMQLAQRDALLTGQMLNASADAATRALDTFLETGRPLSRVDAEEIGVDHLVSLQSARTSNDPLQRELAEMADGMIEAGTRLHLAPDNDIMLVHPLDAETGIISRVGAGKWVLGANPVQRVILDGERNLSIGGQSVLAPTHTILSQGTGFHYSGLLQRSLTACAPVEGAAFSLCLNRSSPLVTVDNAIHLLLYLTLLAAPAFGVFGLYSSLSTRPADPPPSPAAGPVQPAAHTLVEKANINGRIGAWRISLASSEAWINEDAARLFGLQFSGELTTSELFAQIFQDHRNQLRHALEETRPGQTFTMPVATAMSRGETWIELRGSANEPGKDQPGDISGVVFDITDAMRQRERQKSSETRLKTAIEHFPSPFALWDNKHRLIFWNQAFTRIFALEDVVRAGVAYETVMLARSANVISERTTPDDANVTVVGLRSGDWYKIVERRSPAGGLTTFGLDVTQDVKSEEELTQQRKKLRAAVQELARSEGHNVELARKYNEEKAKAERSANSKSAFLANMSHELRTPLNAINGFSEILVNEMYGPLGDMRYNEYARDILTSGQHLLDMINDILDIAKIEAGKMTIDPKPIDLVDPVDAAVRMIRRKAEDKDITLSLQADEPLPEVDADHRAVRQMVLNLLSNAIKFTDPGGRILVAVQKKDDFVRVAVRDTGVGIPKEHLPRLAQPFEQVHETRERNYDGTGLGLALTKSFAEMHGGRFSIASEVGRGTMVSFFLPVSRDVPSRDRDVA